MVVSFVSAVSLRQQSELAAAPCSLCSLPQNKGTFAAAPTEDYIGIERVERQAQSLQPIQVAQGNDEYSQLRSAHAAAYQVPLSYYYRQAPSSPDVYAQAQSAPVAVYQVPAAAPLYRRRQIIHPGNQQAKKPWVQQYHRW